MAELTLTAHLRTTTETAYNNLVNDLNATDEDKNATDEDKAVGTPHEALRPTIKFIADKFIAECGSINGRLASLVATGQATRPTLEEEEAFYSAITTRKSAPAVLKGGTEKLVAAIDATAPDRWGDSVPGPFAPWTRAAAAGLAALHMMYHDGQLDSIHLLYGDTEMHWKQPPSASPVLPDFGKSGSVDVKNCRY